MTTIVVDYGTHIVGLCDAANGIYVGYPGPYMADAVPVIQAADEIVTYNGWKYDLPKLGQLIGVDGDLPLRGIHTDMASICWGEWCSYPKALEYTYLRHFGVGPNLKALDPYVLSNQIDVFRTFELWKLWKRGALKIMNGIDRT